MRDKYSRELEALEHGVLCRFSDWPNTDIPDVAAGLYSIWRQHEFIYIGMSGRGLTSEEIQQKRQDGHRRKALFSRLNSHASGRRSGDQFNLYICDRYVIPSLDKTQIESIAKGQILLDRLTRDYIRKNLQYRYVLVNDGSEALALEDYIRASGLSGLKPELNSRQIR